MARVGPQGNIKKFINILEKINEIISKQLEIPGMQDVRTKYKQNWMNHLEKLYSNILPKHALNYKHRG